MTESPTAIELFAGVGGFRLGLERSGWRVGWSNQWEPGSRVQHASRCYVRRFESVSKQSDSRAGSQGVHVTDNITRVLDAVEAGWYELPDHDLLTAGFPCQDYSVARAASQSNGIQGGKGVLWWEIHRLLRFLRSQGRHPQFLLLENVDRLLKSPHTKRGRDFGIMLASLNDLGYEVEWRVINASDYGYPQRRRRVFIVGRREPTEIHPLEEIAEHGVLSRAFPVQPFPTSVFKERAFRLDGTLADLTREFGAETGGSPFRNAGVARKREVWTRDVFPGFVGPPTTLGTILLPAKEVGSEFEIPGTQLDQWRVLKAAKRQQRYHSSGAPYLYIEGSVPFPDPIDRPARTITAGEGGTSPSRFRHVIEFAPGRFRRLTPVELERLNGFPDGWTDVDVPEGRRAFLMGNALVVGLVEAVGAILATDVKVSRAAESAKAS